MKMLREFMKLEGSAGILLGLTAILALLLVNSPARALYDALLTTQVVIKIGEFSIDKPLLLWVNDGLMAIFFLFVGLEIKREILEGELSTRDQFILPALAATGGMLIPALIYIYFNHDNSVALKGWAIPAATDIAFALGIFALLGNRIPTKLKVCLLAIAILDDLAAIIIIAVFYTQKLSMISIGISVIAIIILTILNRRGVTNLSPYMVTGVFFWACVLKSGVHATLAGVILAFFIPLRRTNPRGEVPLKKLEHGLNPWVAYGFLPLFAFANAGVSFQGLSFASLFEPITLGIAAGLFFGKQIGVFLFTVVGVLCKICKLPRGVNWLQFYGLSLVTGVGFTMSLFIGTLAFKDVDSQTLVRLGVLSGSIISGILGYIILRFAK